MSSGTPDHEGTARVAAALSAALAQRTPEALAPLLGPDVRWGAAEDTEDTCRGRADVLAFYSRSLAGGLRFELRECRVDGDRVRLDVDVAPATEGGEPTAQSMVLTVRDGLVVDVLVVDPS